MKLRIRLLQNNKIILWILGCEVKNMVVIYAEKSSLAKEIASALGAGKRISLKEEPTIGYYQFTFQGEDAVLCHGVGHLAQLVAAKNYDEKYGKWDLDVFPCIPDNFRAAPKQQTVTCLKLVRKFLEESDWAINATDPDREGELIFGYVRDVCKYNKPVKRVWIEDLTDEKIRKAFSNLKNENEQISEQQKGCASDLQYAGRARDIADWVVGTNLTVATTKKFGGFENLLSVGRVQTPTLAMVVNREKQIINHVKTPFWKVTGTFEASGISFEAEHEHGNFDNEAEANNILSACNSKNGAVKSKEVKHTSSAAPLLYNATQLQIACAKKYNWNSDKTMAVMQQLYEHKLMSYPRTSSEHLTEAMMPEVKETIQKLFRLPEYAEYSIPLEQWNGFSKRNFDDSKVGSHPAIIPTTAVPDNLNGVSEDEKMLYDLLVKSMIRMVYPKAELDETSLVIDVDGNAFKANGKVITNAGWYAVDAMPEKMKSLPNVNENDILPGKYEVRKGETEPPKRFTEATLLAAMELAGANIEDEEARTLMKLQKKGLGTDATRVAILKGLFFRQYLERKGKSIIPTEKGIYLIDTLPVDELKSAELTGEWEKRLNDISLGTANFDAFVADIKDIAQKWYSQIAQSTSEKYISSTAETLLCPLCGKELRKQKWGYGCSGYKEGCKFSVGEICSKTITDSQVKALVTKGKTSVIKGFKAKSGKTFDAALWLDKNTGKINFEFSNKK